MRGSNRCSIMPIKSDVSIAKKQSSQLRIFHPNHNPSCIISAEEPTSMNECDSSYYEDDVTHGDGSFYYSPEHQVNLKYIGNVKNGMRNGFGIMLYKNGQSYHGNWMNDKRDGNGIYNFADLHPIYNKYDGHFKNNSFNSQGTLYYKDGSVYRGNFLNSEKSGIGRMNYENDNYLVSYEGQFSRDLRNGEGWIVYKNGDSYEGNWVDNFQSGYGIFNFTEKPEFAENRDFYKGEFFLDGFSGEGKMVWKNGDIYEGNWLNNTRHGQGVMRYKFYGGSLSSNFSDNDNQYWKYEGQFVDDLIKGYGKMYFYGGKICYGYFVDRNGIVELDYGEITWNDMSKVDKINDESSVEITYNKYIGDIKNFRPNGMGRIIGSDRNGGKVKEGVWEDGRFIKEQTVNFLNKQIFVESDKHVRNSINKVMDCKIEGNDGLDYYYCEIF